MKTRKLLLAAALLVGIGIGTWIPTRVHAQATGPAPINTFWGYTKATCPVVAAQTSYCFGTDGIWQSINGAAYVQVGGTTVTGVTSINGKSGALTISSTSNTPTISVNVQ